MFRLGEAHGLGPWEEGLLAVATVYLQFLKEGPWIEPRVVQIGMKEKIA